MPTRRLAIGLLVILTVGTVALFAHADQWKPYEFKGPAFYKYKITTAEGGEPMEIVYSLDIQNAGQPAGAYRVTTSIKTLVKAEDMGAEAFFGSSQALAPVAMLVLGGPMYSAFLGQMDLAVGEKMSFFGAGYAKVVRKQTFAGLEGFVCEIWIKQGDTDQKQAELTIHSDFPFPLRSRAFEDGEPRFDMELLEYRKHS